MFVQALALAMMFLMHIYHHHITQKHIGGKKQRKKEKAFYSYNNICQKFFVWHFHYLWD